jgi:tetratricopeptide (TPR) repeat protein
MGFVKTTPRLDWIIPLALAIAIFAVYAAGACRTIYVGDSGELVTAVYLLGVPHPSGYPLYVMLGKLWTLLFPVGSIAFRMSLFSAACGAAACGLLYRLCRRIDLHPAAATLAALLLASGPSFWSQANIQRVYTLNALFVVLVTTFAWRWFRTRRTRDLAIAFFLCGLGACNHTFMVIAAVALGLFALASEPALLLRPARLAIAGSAFLPGLLPYAYLPIRSRANPRLDWGNPETLEGFLNVIGRGDFWERAWYERPADLFVIGADYAHGLLTELAWGGAALAVAGAIVWGLGRARGSDPHPDATRAGAASDDPASGGVRRSGRIVLLPLLIMAGNLSALALHGSRSDIFIWHRYYIPSYIMAALLAGMGADALIRRVPARAFLAAAVLPFLLPAFLLFTGWRDFDRSRYRIGEEFSRTVLASIPPGAHLIAEDDNILFTLMYLHLVESLRPDVNLILQGVGGADLPPLRFNPEDDPVYFTHHPNWNVPGLEIVPLGIVFRAWKEGLPRPEPSTVPAFLDGELNPRVPKDYLTQNLIGHFHYMQGVTHEDRDWPRARREFDLATAAAPDNDVLFFNLGLIYRRNGLLEDARAAFERSHAINPRHIASHSKPRASEKIAEIDAESKRVTAIEAGLTSDGALRAASPGTPAWHRRMAELLLVRGEPVAARGHLRRAAESEAARGG